MNALFVTFFVLGCALSVQSKCYFLHGGNGRVLDNGVYVPGSVLTWCDVARNSRVFANAQGNAVLNRWDSASRRFDRNMKKGDIPACQGNLWEARNSFCDLADNIVGNDDLATYYATVCEEFGEKLIENDFQKIDDYMFNAYIEFNKRICGSPSA